MNGDNAGKLIIAGFRGTEINRNHHIYRDIKKGVIGGVILFDYDIETRSFGRNITSPEQVSRLIGQLKDAANGELVVAIDQEGGKVCRLKETCGFPPTLSPRQIADTGDKGFAKNEADKMAGLLAELGFNINFAPVVDVDVNPDCPIIGKLGRSYSADPLVVADYAGIFVQAHKERGIVSSLKHFPGHGSSATDSHEGFTDITETWSPAELIPYRELIGRGLCDLVMTGHVYHRILDPTYPATLSGYFLQNVLRTDFNFTGVVISDDLQMGAIARCFGLEEAITVSVRAGIDWILACNNTSLGYDPDLALRFHLVLSHLRSSELCIAEAMETSSRKIEALFSPDRISDC